MSKVKYNPRVAMSLLLAGAFIYSNPGTKAFTTDKAGTHFESKMEDVFNKKTSFAYNMLKNEPDTDFSTHLAYGIQSKFSDLNEFNSILSLNQIFENNQTLIDETVKAGKAIADWLASPAAEGILPAKEPEVEDEPPEEEEEPEPGVENQVTEDELKGGADKTEAELKDHIDGVETPIAQPEGHAEEVKNETNGGI